MTQLLEEVLTEVHKLPPEKQDAIAAVILEELEDTRLWDKAFFESEGKRGYRYSKASPALVLLAKTARGASQGACTCGFSLQRLQALYSQCQGRCRECASCASVFALAEFRSLGEIASENV